MFLPSREVMESPYRMLPHLEGLVRQSVMQRKAGLVPPLLATSVRYRKAPGPEKWQTALETYRDGWGDCDRLAVWRAADLRLEGFRDARVVIKLVRPGLSHAQVFAGGKLFDPSLLLGMRGAA
jgi:hypothetical protein